MKQKSNVVSRRKTHKAGFWFFGFFIGILFTLGVLIGGGLFAYNNVPLRTVNDIAKTTVVAPVTLVVDGKEYDFSKMTLSEAVKNVPTLAKNISALSVGEIEQAFPVVNLDGLLPDSMLSADKANFRFVLEGTEMVSVPMTALRSKKIGDIGGYFVDEVKKQVSLKKIEALGVDFSGIPLVSGKDKTGKDVWFFVKLSEGAVAERYLADRENLFILSSSGRYETATDAEVSAGSTEKTPLFYRTRGIIDLPIADALFALTELTDEKTTLGECIEAFGLPFEKAADGKYADALVEKMAHKPLSALANLKDELTLPDVTTLRETDVFYAAQFLHDQEGNVVLDENGDKVLCPISLLAENINRMRLSEIVKSDERLLAVLGDVTLDGLEARVRELKLSDVVPVTENAPRVLLTMRDWKLNEISDRIENLTVADVTETEGNRLLTTLKDKKICDLEEVAENLQLHEILEISEDAPVILQKVRNCTLQNLTETVRAFTVSDLVSYEGKETDFFARLLKEVGASPFENLGNAISGSKIKNLFDVYESGTGNLCGVWKILLSGYVRHEDKSGVRYIPAAEASLSDLNRLLSDLPEKLGAATVGDLVESGILTGITPENDLRAYTLNELLTAISENWNVVKNIL